MSSESVGANEFPDVVGVKTAQTCKILSLPHFGHISQPTFEFANLPRSR